MNKFKLTQRCTTIFFIYYNGFDLSNTSFIGKSYFQNVHLEGGIQKGGGSKGNYRDCEKFRIFENEFEFLGSWNIAFSLKKAKFSSESERKNCFFLKNLIFLPL